MVKAEIIRSIEVQLGLSHQEATGQVEQILTLLKDHLTEGGYSSLDAESPPSELSGRRARHPPLFVSTEREDRSDHAVRRKVARIGLG